MTKPTAAPWITPKGYTFSQATKFQFEHNGEILPIGFATEAELELWQICEALREKIGKLAESSCALLEALSKEVKTSAERRMRDTEVMEAFESVKAAIAEAEKS